ncbi:hypothetical protein LC55x_1517 [Lysobacter capsici]|nr:hypothetical protein LC55x_1517 [Lysobacter capsici]
MRLTPEGASLLARIVDRFGEIAQGARIEARYRPTARRSPDSQAVAFELSSPKP